MKTISVPYMFFIYLIMIIGLQMVALECKEMAENSECLIISFCKFGHTAVIFPLQITKKTFFPALALC